jgi:hypothetical protein
MVQRVPWGPRAAIQQRSPLEQHAKEKQPPQKKRHGHSVAYPHCLIMVGESLCVRVWQMRACERRQIPESSRKMRPLDDAYFSSAIHCDAAVEEMRAAGKQKQSKQQQCGVREFCGATHGSTGRGLADAERKKSDKETREKKDVACLPTRSFMRNDAADTLTISLRRHHNATLASIRSAKGKYTETQHQ